MLSIASIASAASASPKHARPAAATAKPATTTTAPATPTLATLKRPDLWDSYMTAQGSLHQSEARDLLSGSTGSGFNSIDALNEWERTASKVAVERAAGRKPTSGIAHLIVDAPSARITSDYGVRVDPMGDGLDVHCGIDIGAPMGSPIRAVAAGRVTKASYSGGYGFMVEVQHKDGAVSRYAHASALLTEVGRDVDAGEVIAHIGSTGESTGPHTHFEIRRNGKPIDPHDYVRDYVR